MPRIAIYALLLFVVVTLTTASLHSPADGYDLIGFPFRFYSHTSGKCHECHNWCRPELALLDLACCFPAALVLDLVSRRLLHSKNERR